MKWIQAAARFTLLQSKFVLSKNNGIALRCLKGRFRLAKIKYLNSLAQSKMELSGQANWETNFLQPIKLQERSSFFERVKNGLKANLHWQKMSRSKVEIHSNRMFGRYFPPSGDVTFTAWVSLLEAWGRYKHFHRTEISMRSEKY